MQIDPAAAHVKYVFSVLQTLQVMMPACLERCLCRLRWADSNIPEIHSGDSSLSSCCPDFFKLKYAETKLFANLYVKWDNVSKGEYSFLVMVSGHELLDMLLVLSGGRCFKTQPLNLDAVSAIAWLHNLSQFTLGQFIAGAIELALWKAFGRRSEPVEVRSMSAASTCIHQLLCHCAWDQHDSLYMVYQEGQRALKDLMNCDVSLLSFFSSIMKPRVKAAVGALTANYVGSQQTPLLRLWAAASAAMSWHNSLLLFQSSMIKHKVSSIFVSFIFSTFICLSERFFSPARLGLT